MMKRKYFFRFWLLLFFIVTAFSFSANAQANSSVKVTALYIQTPLFKRLSSNGAIRVRVYVPAGKTISYRSMQLHLNADALNAIEKLEVLSREDKETAFLLTASVLAEIKPSSNIVDVPIRLNCQPGLNYLWI